MGENNVKKTIKLLFVLSLILFSEYLEAQKNTKGNKPTPKSFTRKEYSEIIDSLYNLTIEYRISWEKAQATIHNRDSTMAQMQQLMQKIQSSLNEAQSKNSDFKNRNLKLDQSNRILIIFNSIVGVLLLATLVWFLRNIGKKKMTVKPKPDLVFDATTSTNTISASPKSNNIHFENKLEQLERLGKLREKGILNDEEFNRQKQEILSSGL